MACNARHAAQRQYTGRFDNTAGSGSISSITEAFGGGEGDTPSLLPRYIIMPPLDHAPSGSGLTSAAEPDGGAEPPSGPLSDADDAAVAGASRCAVDPGTSSSWIFRHSAPPSERTGHPTWSAHVCMFQKWFSQKTKRGAARIRDWGGGNKMR